jgi:uracil-DNA glycosylase
MLEPRVVIAVGQLAIARFLGAGRLEDRVGHSFGSSPVIVPLPHPSGQSRWLNVPANRNRLSRALDLIRELREQFIPR